MLFGQIKYVVYVLNLFILKDFKNASLVQNLRQFAILCFFVELLRYIREGLLLVGLPHLVLVQIPNLTE